MAAADNHMSAEVRHSQTLLLKNRINNYVAAKSIPFDVNDPTKLNYTLIDTCTLVFITQTNTHSYLTNTSIIIHWRQTAKSFCSH